MEREALQEKIEQAEMILVGLGEDFDGTKRLRQREGYEAGCECLKDAGKAWLIPAWNEYCLEESGDRTVEVALEKLDGFLEGKNCFFVSVSTNSRIFWKKNTATEIAGAGVGAEKVGEVTAAGGGRLRRVVMPCGSVLRKQCASGCENVLEELTVEEREGIRRSFRDWDPASGQAPGSGTELGVCPDCGAPFILNNIYAENYNEKGYLDQWNLYMKWLQGTLNRRLLVLELGVGMRFPSVIRWPFEKTAFFNQKAYFCRVHEKLYQLTKELAGKGCGISQDAVDWLARL